MRTDTATAPVDVIVPARDYGRYLRECIESIYAQTVPPATVLVIDDGSRDDTAAVLGALAERFPIVRVHREARGLATTLREGIERTTSDYFVTLDADDTLTPTFIEECLNAFASKPEAAYCYTQMQYVGDREGLFASQPFNARELICRGNYIGGRSAMIRRSAYLRTAGYRDLSALEDWDLWLSFLDQGMAGTFIPKPLYVWRQHGQSRNRMSIRHERRLRRRIQLAHPLLLLRYYPGYLKTALRNLARRFA